MDLSIKRQTKTRTVITEATRYVGVSARDLPLSIRELILQGRLLTLLNPVNRHNVDLLSNQISRKDEILLEKNETQMEKQSEAGHKERERSGKGGRRERKSEEQFFLVILFVL